jgi:hypothetical protein
MKWAGSKYRPEGMCVYACILKVPFYRKVISKVMEPLWVFLRKLRSKK